MKKEFKDIFEIDQIQLAECIREGSQYKCVLIKAGETNTANKTIVINNQNVAVKKFYTAEAIRNAVNNGIFEGCPAMFRDEKEHLNVSNTGINQYVGNFRNVIFNEEKQQAEGILFITQNNSFAQQFKIKLAEAWNTIKQIGLSISATINGMLTKKENNEYLIVVGEIESLQSVDVVAKGNAGGKIIELIAESINNNLPNKTYKTGELQMNQEIKQKIFDLLSAAKMLGDGKTIDNVSDEDLLQGLYQHTLTLMNIADSSMSEAEKTANKTALTSAKALLDSSLQSSTLKIQSLVAEAQKIASGNYLNTKIAESTLPVPFKDKIKKLYGNKVFTTEEIDALFVAEQEAYSKLTPVGGFAGQRLAVGENEIDKFQKAMDWLMINPTTRAKMTVAELEPYKDVKGNYSFKEMYRQYTGDHQVTGKIFKGSMGEAIDSTTFAAILGVSMHRSMILEYVTSQYNLDWRKLVSIVPRTDFKTNTISRLGGYDDLPVVPESGPYVAATTPGEEAVTYALLKRGYTEVVSMEAIRNDDLGAIRGIAIKWGRASARTLYKYVMNKILTNPTMAYDSKALFHADHFNLTSTANALSATSYAAARKMLALQKEVTNAEPIGLAPKYLLVPIELEKTAYELTSAAYGKSNAVPEFYQTWKVEPIVIANSANDRDWYLTADPGEATLMELGFLDGNEEPEFFVQDLPTQGYAFSNDGLKYKVRHIYAGAIVDHRAAVMADVPSS